MKKMTYVDALDLAIANLCENETIYDGANTISPEETVARLAALRDTLIKRAQTPRKPSAKAIEARKFRETVEDWIRHQGYTTVTAKELARELNVTTQRMTAALNALVKMGILVKGDGWYEFDEFMSDWHALSVVGE